MNRKFVTMTQSIKVVIRLNNFWVLGHYVIRNAHYPLRCLVVSQADEFVSTKTKTVPMACCSGHGVPFKDFLELNVKNLVIFWPIDFLEYLYVLFNIGDPWFLAAFCLLVLVGSRCLFPILYWVLNTDLLCVPDSFNK